MSLFTRNKRPMVVETAVAEDARRSADDGEPLPTLDPALETAIHRIGADFLARAGKNRAGVLSGVFWSDKLMEWAMKDEAFKVQLFRFVDAFPRLKTPEAVHDHLVDYLGQPGVTLPPGLGMSLKAGGLLKGAMTKTLTGRITSMAEKFIAGTDAASALPLLEKLWGRSIAFSVDLLGEACLGRTEAAAYQRKYLDLVRNLPDAASKWPANERLETDHLGPIPRTNVSIKISALQPGPDPIAAEATIARFVETLRPILEAARDKGVLINFDMEQFELKDLTLDLFMRCCEEVDFEAGLAMQAYLRSGDDDARRIVEWSRRTGRQITVRLVKGAYWDFETIQAEEMGWPVPVWSRKADTDACFERMTRQFVDAIPRRVDAGGVKLALGSHNARSIAAALAMIEAEGLPPSALEIQMLHGMGDELKAAAVDMGLRVREYLPVGEMIPGMAYLVRRLLENTSNESWLRAGFSEEATIERLLATPHRQYAAPDPGVERIRRGPERHRLAPAVPGVGDERPFANEPPRDFSRAAVRDRFHEAVAGAAPPEPGPDASADAVERAVVAARAALSRWRAEPSRTRCAVLVQAAEIMRRRRDDLCGLIIREAGKSWREADAEVCEAIDFCEYYARRAVALFEPRRLGVFIGEMDEIVHQPRGVAVVINPWNFPLSILCAQTAAALVTGNPTIVKPPHQAPGAARVFRDILLEAGCPADVIHLVPGPGETVGRQLVSDPRIAIVAYSGSREAGLEIIAAAGQSGPGQAHLKKVICTTGAANAIIVDDSADLDEAVLGVRRSAFGYQGQKYSACVQAIVLESTYETFLARLCESTQVLSIGDPLDPAVGFGPMIDAAHAEAVRAHIEVGKSEARLALAVDLPEASRLAPGRAYVAPHIFAEVPPDARIASEEILGPVLSVLRASSFEQALSLAGRTKTALTGGVYSRKPSHLARARAEFRVGNLYLNRPITGARVGRQPYGGLCLSGTGTTSGGPDDLLHFVEPRSICENTMRRGFAPELDN